LPASQLLLIIILNSLTLAPHTTGLEEYCLIIYLHAGQVQEK